MSTNDVVLLEDMIDRSRSETAELRPAEQEAYFVARHYLRYYHPTHDDLLSGIVDGAGDGGLDAIYIFVNGFCVRDDTELTALGRHAQLDLILMQVKNTKGFTEAPINKMVVNLPVLLDFSRDEHVLAREFNPRVLEITRRFLNVYRALTIPNLNIHTAFASLRADSVHPNTRQKAEYLKNTLLSCFGTAGPIVDFLDAASIADMARDRPPISRQLALAENPISTNMSGGYVGVVSLLEYQRFITDDLGKLDVSLFEANVRDYEGETGVNRNIRETLEREDRAVDFWWLNNGVTIVANKVQPAGKLLALETPQIVNGLQTSYEIYKRGPAKDKEDGRSILVKVIQAEKDDVKDRIIQATNSQTTLGLSALRATDKVQRQIEEHLMTQGLYYERRKNYYQNRSIPLEKLVSIDQMGQAVMSTLVQVPHIARGQVSRIFQDEIYHLVFAEDHPIHMYSISIQIVRRCKEFLREVANAVGHIDDFVFHLGMFAAVVLTRKQQPKAQDLANIEVLPDDNLLENLLPIVRDEFSNVARACNEVLFDRVAKNPMTSKRLQERAHQYLISTTKGV